MMLQVCQLEIGQLTLLHDVFQEYIRKLSGKQTRNEDTISSHTVHRIWKYV